MTPIQRTIIALLLTCATATAQRLDPAPPATASPAPKPAARPGEATITAGIFEPKLSGKGLADLYRKFTGHRVLVSAAAATAEFSVMEEASPQEPLTYGQAAERLKIAATLENFAFVPDEQDPNLDILTLATRPNRGCGGLKVYNEGDPLPAAGEYIMYVMTFKYLKPADAVRILTKRFGKLSPDGSIAAVPGASAVVITDKTALIRMLIEFKKVIDTPSYQILCWLVA